MKISRHHIRNMLADATINSDGWVSFKPKNNKGRLLTMDELKSMPVVRLVALVRRLFDYIQIKNEECLFGYIFSDKTIFQICYINDKEGWGYSDLEHIKMACKGKGNIPTKKERKLQRQYKAQKK